jgi:fumarate hydratase, class I
MKFQDAIVELYKKNTSTLPKDMVALMKQAHKKERNARAKSILKSMLDNITLAKKEGKPLCQDTGSLLFYVDYPTGVSTLQVRKDIKAATKKATKLLLLRENAVDPITGKNSGDGTGEEFPFIHFNEWTKDFMRVRVIQKGGGCENVSSQYSLPNGKVGAGRDLDGVRKVVLDAVFQAQGRGCAPGILAVGIGGDRLSSYDCAKKQLLRKLDDTNDNSNLAKLERTILTQANKLGIGPMGLGGDTTVLAVKMGAVHRVPASYFVSIAYMCWSNRRGGIHFQNGKITKWL